MKLHIDASIKNINLQKFEWENTYFQITLNIKNNYPIKIKLNDIKFNLINSLNEKFLYGECDYLSIKSKENKDITFDLILNNKEFANLINNFINFKKSIFKIHIINGKANLFSVIPFNLKNYEHNIDILNIINYLYRS
ncbi:hypothetical protein [Brachyspira hyodysenteriae]|uniref:Uncharacterized protein n=2 Tax=Brachyspira hyodysenteriae TaxID=159 RepID=A0A3B6V965_BRAHW|nr:hypothetical protein [Brachyspira hyodysenteriae]ACN84042.1 hypothetical protein BHWA1_01572 [Brachyspira hyodysenteriae WA1]ANN63851.1 hypothetical protein BHYOB78_08220 [Brachyspira hyodysenteriae ATCC 27164]AUJ49771.1 hypothetical protein BH718_01330 [Brachyspira hyodysenteriae]KLI22512.1 hypothetical protein SZ47_13250 [Brachyspira hyodysenteriae]KLI29618.1 hypothetical protein SZ49_09865 [Brachyspira hyodysenteriae]